VLTRLFLRSASKKLTFLKIIMPEPEGRASGFDGSINARNIRFFNL
jgi:hypothetical protein